MRLLRSNRGVSIVECMIAMIIVTLVGIAAVTTARASANHAEQVTEHAKARTTAENALEVYKFTDSIEEYNRVVTQADTYLPSDNTYVYRSEHYTLTIRVSYPDFLDEDASDGFSATASDENGHKLFTIEYRKG